MLTTAASLLLLASSALAVKVTTPTESSVWQSNGGAQTVSWETVSSDPTSFAIVLVNMGSQNHLDSPVVLVQNQSASAGSASVSDPSGAWPTGVAYQINLVKSSTQTDAILAQSNQFNITQGGSASSSSSSSSSSSASSSMMMSSSTSAMSSSGAMSTGSATAGAASTSAESGIPPAASSSKSSASSLLHPSSSSGAVIAMSLVAGTVLAGAMSVSA